MSEEQVFALSNSTKKSFLNSIISRCYKILHLIEELPTTGFEPDKFIHGLWWEVAAADSLFEGKLASVVIKIKGIEDDYRKMSFQDVKSQINEIKRIINRILREIGG